ncbi:hypothetical protein [Mucilaginibacter arboris]|uniref:Uncharacterized protein n=1 Tax=Mucilaginibacter arboris TaxID=2682090 RepID=A0A7K1ST05_9SPHI|nr:hypothetical protein [Mucilaginibacter arboris]MVN20431.1 hypothetical protein [Mucilaginibacter arboris]
MIKRFIETLYKVMFNHFLKIDGAKGKPSLIACCATALFINLFMLNISCVFSVMLNIPVKANYNKLEINLFVLTTFGLTYLLLFSVFQFKKVGDGADGFFIITERTKKIIWLVFWGNLVLMFVLALFRKYYFHL